MIPYFPQPVLTLGPVQIHAFGVLAAVAVVLGGRVLMIRAHRQGIAVEQMFRFAFWVYASAMVGAVISKFIMDGPHSSLGVRSAGGIGGGFIAAIVWCRHHRLSVRETIHRLDVVAYAMPFAWMIGRLGCALAHDHRGLASTSFIAVNFPEGPRFDLGLIEFLYLIPLTLLFKFLDRRPRPIGFFLGLYGILYGGFRVWLDTLHIQPNRFIGGTIAVALGILFTAYAHFKPSFARSAPAPLSSAPDSEAPPSSPTPP
jgi:phosphatidylglycerol:prolipoprotein diacylglycerol transferase